MTWQDARQDAQELAAGFARSHPVETEIVLVLFDSAKTFGLLRNTEEAPASWSYATQLMRATARELRRKHGRRARLVTIELAKYQQWLSDTGRNHSASSQQQYALTLS